MTRRARAVTAGLVIAMLHVSRAAAADPPACPTPCNLRIPVPTVIREPVSGNELVLPPGFFEDDGVRKIRETEMKRLQEREVRLDAENRKLREQASKWHPGWRTVGIALAVGLAAGGYAAHRWW